MLIGLPTQSLASAAPHCISSVQVPSEVQPRPVIHSATPPKKPGAHSKPKTAKAERGPSKIKRSHEHQIKPPQIKPQLEKPTRTELKEDVSDGRRDKQLEITNVPKSDTFLPLGALHV